MHKLFKHTWLVSLLLIVYLFSSINTAKAQSAYGINDTIVSVAVVYEGDTIEAKTLAGVYVWKRDPAARAKWTRLRNAVYVTYPYALRAGLVFNDIEKHIASSKDKKFVTAYINSREKELKKEVQYLRLNALLWKNGIVRGKETLLNMPNLLRLPNMEASPQTRISRDCFQCLRNKQVNYLRLIRIPLMPNFFLH